MKVELTDLLRLHLQPGDRLIVRVKGHPDSARAAYVRGIVSEWAGGDFPALVLDDSASFEVVTAAAGGVQEIVR